MDAALNGLNADAARVPDAFAPWTAPERGGAGTAGRSADWIAAQPISPLCKAGIDAQMIADNGVDDAPGRAISATWRMIKGGGVEKYWTETEVYRCAGGTQQLALQPGAASSAGARAPAPAGRVRSPSRSRRRSSRPAARSTKPTTRSSRCRR